MKAMQTWPGFKNDGVSQVLEVKEAANNANVGNVFLRRTQRLGVKCIPNPTLMVRRPLTPRTCELPRFCPTAAAAPDGKALAPALPLAPAVPEGPAALEDAAIPFSTSC